MPGGKVRVFVGLGANLGVGRDNLLAAWARLGREPGIVCGRLSRPWRSEPVGMASPHWFTNAVGEIFVTARPPDVRRRSLELGWSGAPAAADLLALLLAIEGELGRDRTRQGRDRPIDLDLLLYGAEVINLPHCRVPHPELANRRFVLEPLRELAPELRHPRLHRTIAELADAAAAAGGQRLEALNW